MARGGKRDGAGRKKGSRKIPELKEILDKAWPQSARREFFEKLAKMAKDGDKEAGKILLERSYGKATEHHEVTGVQEIRIIRGPKP